MVMASDCDTSIAYCHGNGKTLSFQNIHFAAGSNVWKIIDCEGKNLLFKLLFTLKRNNQKDGEKVQCLRNDHLQLRNNFSFLFYFRENSLKSMKFKNYSILLRSKILMEGLTVCIFFAFVKVVQKLISHPKAENHWRNKT